MIVLAAQHASGGLSGWEQLGIVVAGSLIAATIIGAFSWIRKPAHRVHVVGMRLNLVREWEDELRDAPDTKLKVALVVTNTGDISLFVMLAKLSVWVDSDLLDELDAPPVKHELAPDQRHTLRGELPWSEGFEAAEKVTVMFELDYGRRVLWRFRRRITATIEAKMPWSLWGSGPFHNLHPIFATGGSPRDRLARRLWS